ncbi:hypothetical protein [Levilactobacillus brevis]|uniref:hypothetical protein n=2 Tax=Levilactobacillus brevis TaxID=1580 RepID=UPI001F433B51|nr:hypothetical protein [Levilactobacillus brevis]
MMFKHKLMANDSPVPALKASREQFATLVQEHPWLIPATVALEVLPATATIHGYWKLRQLKKQLQIEKEHTKQRQLERFAPNHRHDGRPQLLADHPHHPHFNH